MTDWEGVRITMADCEATILREIAEPSLHQRDIAQRYRLAMDSHEALSINWERINRAICERWSKSVLVRIKQMAHSGACFKPRKEADK